MTTIIMDREPLLDRLKEQLAVAKLHDKEALAKHREKEREYLATFRAAAKVASRWSYEELLAARARSWGSGEYEVSIKVGAPAPACPVAMAPQFQKAIEYVTLSKQAQYTMNPGGTHGELWLLVTWDPDPPPRDLCS